MAHDHITVPALTAEKQTVDPLSQALGLLGQNGPGQLETSQLAKILLQWGAGRLGDPKLHWGKTRLSWTPPKPATISAILCINNLFCYEQAVLFLWLQAELYVTVVTFRVDKRRCSQMDYRNRAIICWDCLQYIFWLLPFRDFLSATLHLHQSVLLPLANISSEFAQPLFWIYAYFWYPQCCAANMPTKSGPWC